MKCKVSINTVIAGNAYQIIAKMLEQEATIKITLEDNCSLTLSSVLRDFGDMPEELEALRGFN